MSIDNAEIIRAATALGVIGGGSQSAHRILAALCDPALSATELAAIVQREPGLAMRVLKVANSAYYGRSREVTSLDRALMVMGLDAVRGIASAACLDRSVVRRGDGTLDADALISHSVGACLAAEAIAKIRHRSLAAEALMGGLLHDFGVLVQERLDPEGVRALIEQLALQPDADVTALEPSLAKIGHARCTQVVFESWKLPQLISLAVLHHHDPLAAPGPARELAALVHLGIQVSLDAGFAHALEPGPLPIPREPVLQLLQIDAESLRAITDHLPEQVLLLADADA